MKITETPAPPSIQNAASKQAAPPPAQEEADRVTLERTRTLQADVEQAKAGAGAARAAQLQALEVAIRNGSFRPSSQQLAEKLLQSAELDARLRALLHRG